MPTGNQRTTIPGSDRVDWPSPHYPGQYIGASAGRNEVEFTKRRLDGEPSGHVLQPLLPGVQIFFPERDVMLAHRGADLPGPRHGSLYGTCYPLPQVWFYCFRPVEHGVQESNSRIEKALPVIASGAVRADPVMEQAIKTLGHDVTELLTRGALRIGKWVVTELRRIPAVPT